MTSTILQPYYYQVVWNDTANTYNGLTGDQAGGIDNINAEHYNRIITITGTVSTPTVTSGQSIYINSTLITFTSTTLTQCVIDINTWTRSTGVYAYSSSNHLVLMNASTFEGQPIVLEAGDSGTALSDLGLTATVYRYWPSEQSGSMSLPVSDGDTIKINGITITFTSGGGLNLAGVIATINSYTDVTTVIAYASGSGMKLAATDQQPWTMSDVTTGVLAKLGFTSGNHGGQPATLLECLNKERANMRWQQIVNYLGSLISPVLLGDFIRTGNYDGSAPLATLTWTVAYDRPEYLAVPDVLNSGEILYGADAVKRLVATALMWDINNVNQEIYDPSIITFGDNCSRPNPARIMNLTSAALDTSITNLEAKLTVTVISYT